MWQSHADVALIGVSNFTKLIHLPNHPFSPKHKRWSMATERITHLCTISAVISVSWRVIVVEKFLPFLTTKLLITLKTDQNKSEELDCELQEYSHERNEFPLLEILKAFRVNFVYFTLTNVGQRQLDFVCDVLHLVEQQKKARLIAEQIHMLW